MSNETLACSALTCMLVNIQYGIVSISPILIVVLVLKLCDRILQGEIADDDVEKAALKQEKISMDFFDFFL